MYRWVPSQRRTTKVGERDSPARLTGERDFRPKIFRKGVFPRRPRRGHRGAGFATGCPAGVPRRGHWGAEFSFAGVAAFQRSCVSLGPFKENDDEARGADSPARVTGERDFRRGPLRSLEFSPTEGFFRNSPSPGAGFPAGVAGERNFPPPGSREAGFSLWERESLFRNCPSPGAGFSTGFSLKVALQKFPLAEPDSPAGVTGERDFRPGPPPGLLGSGIFPRRVGVAGSGFFSLGAGVSSEIPPRRERDSPAGVTGERDFRPGPPRSLGSGIFPRRGCGKRGFPPPGSSAGG